MKSQNIFNFESFTSLAERVEYEIWLLEAVYAIVEQDIFPTWPDEVIYPANKSQAQFYSFGRFNCVIGDWRPGFLNAGAPLIFITTFKLLDMLIEWVLDVNKIKYNFPFKQKLKEINVRAPIFPEHIETRGWLKERIIGLYSTLAPLRGTIIHSKHFTSNNGGIVISTSKNGIVSSSVDIDANQLRSLAVFFVSTLRYIQGIWSFDDIREKYLRHTLDDLEPLHGCPLLNQKHPYHTCVRVYIQEQELFTINPSNIQETLDARYKDHDCSFDLKIITIKNGKSFNAYFLPKKIISKNEREWYKEINFQQYETALPTDIKSEHISISIS
ncbi:hypothetical protein [Delftia acidovorans]|uniref:hypothetical protein n=1 Tax=Delftia acidovorans TaxID=80866 RepID=UPI003D0EFC03